MAFHAPDCGKDLGVCETFILNVPRVLREGRRGGAREFYSTGDLRVELGLLFTDEEDIEEFNDMCGPLVLARGRESSWRFQEADVVWNHEEIQLQGYLHVVHVRPRKRKGLQSPTLWRRRGRRKSKD